jgi:hypothetical protein
MLHCFEKINKIRKSIKFENNKYLIIINDSTHEID